jgi:hypothetical protein
MKNIPPVIRQFSRTQFSKTIAVLLFSGLLIAMPAATQAQSFVGGPITFNDGDGMGSSFPGTPYPSSIVVAGLGTSLSSITLTLTNFTRSSRTDDIDMVLIGPTGASLIVFSDVGGLGGNGPITITLADGGGNPFLPDAGPLVGGTFRPTNESTAQDSFPGAPAGPYGNPGGATAGVGPNTFATQFNGTNPNGTWRLYIVDDAAPTGGETGSISGWTLNITAVPEPATWALLVAGAGALAFFRRKRA